MTFKNKHGGVLSGKPRHTCTDEIDYSYVKMPPERSMGFRGNDTRIVSCTMGYKDKKRDCAGCDSYSICDAKERANIEGKEWTPPMRSRSEMEAKIKYLEEIPGQNIIWNPDVHIRRHAMVDAIEWVLGKRKEL